MKSCRCVIALCRSSPSVGGVRKHRTRTADYKARTVDSHTQEESIGMVGRWTSGNTNIGLQLALGRTEGEGRPHLTENCQKNLNFCLEMCHLGLKTLILGKFRGKIENFSTCNLLCLKCAAFCQNFVWIYSWLVENCNFLLRILFWPMTTSDNSIYRKYRFIVFNIDISYCCLLYTSPSPRD